MSIEIIRPGKTGNFRYAVLDFDGTLSLIREGWQAIMIPYFADEMANTPKGRDMPYEAIYEKAKDFITQTTGKQTIYQCIQLADEVRGLGGTPLDPQVYKDEYSARLLRRIDDRLTGLENGTLDPEKLTVPGTYDLLEMLLRHDVTPYVASGTDEAHVLREAHLVGVDKYVKHIYGAQREYKTFSKKMVIERILKENNLSGESLLGFGDGFVEIENIHEVGGFAVGAATDERAREGIDAWKRERLISAGANLIVPDFREIDRLEALLFN